MLKGGFFVNETDKRNVVFTICAIKGRFGMEGEL
jgi:hypothetical protein